MCSCQVTLLVFLRHFHKHLQGVLLGLILSHITIPNWDVIFALGLEMALSLHPGYLGSLRQLEPLLRVCSFLRKIPSLNVGIYSYSTLQLVAGSSEQFKIFS